MGVVGWEIWDEEEGRGWRSWDEKFGQFSWVVAWLVRVGGEEICVRGWPL
jgi:hypothetical protein